MIGSCSEGGVLGVPAPTPTGIACGRALQRLWLGQDFYMSWVFWGGGRSCFSSLPLAPSPQPQVKRVGGSQRQQREQDPNTQEHHKRSRHHAVMFAAAAPFTLLMRTERFWGTEPAGILTTVGDELLKTNRELPAQ